MRTILNESAKMPNKFREFLAITQVFVWLTLIEESEGWQHIGEIAELHERLFQTLKRQMRNHDFEFDCFVIRESHCFDFDGESLADGVPWRLGMERYRVCQFILIGCSLAALGVVYTLLKRTVQSCDTFTLAPICAGIVSFFVLKLWYWCFQREMKWMKNNRSQTY